jgi:hypothetical protein
VPSKILGNVISHNRLYDTKIIRDMDQCAINKRTTFMSGTVASSRLFNDSLGPNAYASIEWKSLLRTITSKFIRRVRVFLSS